MGSHPGNRYLGTCTTTGKRQYTDRKTAKAVAREQRDGNVPYPCEACGFFHVGHQGDLSRDEHRQRHTHQAGAAR